MTALAPASNEVEMTGGNAAGGAAAPTGFNKYDPADYDVLTAAHDGYKATEIKLNSFKRPHMRAFHYSWISFFLAFFAWFAFAPLCDKVGAKNLQAGLMIYGGFMILLAAMVVRD